MKPKTSSMEPPRIPLVSDMAKPNTLAETKPRSLNGKEEQLRSSGRSRIEPMRSNTPFPRTPPVSETAKPNTLETATIRSFSDAVIWFGPETAWSNSQQLVFTMHAATFIVTIAIIAIACFASAQICVHLRINLHSFFFCIQCPARQTAYGFASAALSSLRNATSSLTCAQCPSA